MAIDFPNSPAPGDNFTANSKTWTFADGKWALNVNSLGVTGATGPSGPQGVTGVSGAASSVSGPSGPSGPQGEPGLGGLGGLDGPTGPSGPSGPQGAQGTQGAAGTNGTNGAQGVSGIPGGQGVSGVSGVSGVPGGQGGVGPTGATGGVGPTGATGGVGPQGPGGPQGAQGPAGPQGAQGPAGPGANQDLNTYNGPTFANLEVPTIGSYTSDFGNGSPFVRVDNGALRRTASNREYKNSIEDIQDGLSYVLSLRPRYFKWNERTEDSELTKELNRSLRDVGFITEEVLETSAELVFYEKNSNDVVMPVMWKANGVIALLVKSVQELSAQVEILKTEVNTLKNS